MSTVTEQGQVKPITSFDPNKHRPPSYNIYGHLNKVNPCADHQNILSTKDNIKLPWVEQGQSEPMTRTKLLEIRRKEKIPDISYDLDRDGFVGGRDYVLSKRFDTDKDGKLNEKEKKTAYEAIHNNIEDNYVWNLDNQGAKRSFRTLQKRGKVIESEDFMPVMETYPVHPLSSIAPRNNIKTFTDLKEERKKVLKEDINERTKKWEKENPQTFVQEQVNIGGQRQPSFTSMSEVRKEKRKLARIKCNLDEKVSDIKITDKDPGLSYVENPIHKVPNDLREARQRENMEQSKKLASIKHKNEIVRLNEREDEVFNKIYSDENRTTLSKIKEQRRKENLDYNMKHFSRQTIGVHGQELPKFSENEEMKEYWKHKEGYVEQPEVNSQMMLKENRKFWKKREELLINEHQDHIPSPDAFRREKILNEKKQDLIIKVNNLNHFKNFDPDNPKPIDIEENHRKHIYKWTSLVHQFAPQKFKKGRLFDSLVKASEEQNINNSYEREQIFSSEYMNGLLGKRETKMIKLEEVKNVQDTNVKPIKDTLYAKFSTKDSSKFDKNPYKIRSKGF